MAHFNLRQGLFQSPHEESIYVNGRENEYIRYDYSFDEDIVPAINKLFPDNEPMPEGRPLQNVKAFLQGSLIGLCFKEFDFSDVNSAGALFAATSAPYISVLYFVNCRFGTNGGIDIPEAGVGFYDCVFDGNFYVGVKGDSVEAPIEFNNCVINGLLSFQDIKTAIPVEIERCLFNENSKLNMSGFNKSKTVTLYHLDIRNSLFKGEFVFDDAVIPSNSIFEYLTFYNTVSFKNTEMGSKLIWKNLSFSPFMNKATKDGFKSFTAALQKNGYSREAEFYEKNIGIEAAEAKINKDAFDIAARSNWLNIKQTAAFLGISYTTLLAMRKEDKAGGVRRIPYIGEGKNSRYYLPLLEAYKSQNWKLVSELAKEMEGK